MKLPLRTPIINPAAGFLLGLAAFLISFLAELLFRPIAGSTNLVALVIGLTGLVLLLLFLGSPLNPWKLLRVGSGAALGGFAGFSAMILIYLSPESDTVFPVWVSGNTIEVVTFVVMALLYSIIFALLAFGREAVRYFALVFTLAAIPIGIYAKPFSWRAVFPDSLDTLIQRFTQFPSHLAFIYLSIGALTGMSIALFHRSKAKVTPTNSPQSIQ